MIKLDSNAPSISNELAKQHIDHVNSKKKYAPPGHGGTVNVRLVDKTFCENFEMVLGRIEVGGIAERHHHEAEHQAIYVMSGCARVILGADDPVDCGPGSIISLPPKLNHHVTAIGDTTLELMIIYSPPLAERADISVE